MPIFTSSFRPNTEFPVTKETGYYIPEFASDKEKRLAALQAEADKRGAGTIWSLDNKGNFVVTNTPETRGKLHASTPTMATLDEQMKSISALPPEQRIKGLIDLQGTVQLYAAQRQQAALSAAEAELGVPSLKAELEKNIALDKQDPRYYEFQSDSPITQRVRAAYEDAVNRARSRADVLLSTDGELQAILTKSKLFSELQIQDIEKAQSQAAKAAELSQNLVKVASWVQGRPVSPLEVLKSFEKYSAYEALSNNPAALIEQTIVNKDPGAASILAHKQTALVAKTEDETSPVYQAVYKRVQKEIAAMSAIMADNAIFEEQYLKLFSTGNEKTDKSTLLALRQNPKEYATARRQTAEAFIQDVTMKNFEADVGSWIMASSDGQLINPFGIEGTPLHTAFVRAKEKNKIVSLAALISEIKALPPEQATAAMAELEKAAQNAYEHASGGYYGKARDSLDIRMLLNKKIVETSVFGSTLARDIIFGAGVGAGVGLLPGLSIPTGALIGAGAGAAVGTIHGLYNTLTAGEK